MTGAQFLPPAVTKEVRALLPIWLATAVAIAAAGVTAGADGLAAGVFAYGLGALVLGAHSMGHEYSHRTLGLLLSQPADRRRVYMTKLAVLACMLLVLSAIARAALLRYTGGHTIDLIWLAALCGLCLAPWLTMVCRSSLAGVVFTVALPMLVLLAGDLIGVALYGVGAAGRIDAFKLAMFWPATVGICAAAAVSSWRAFMRLEAVEGRGPRLHLPRWLRGPGGSAEAVEAAPARTRSASWQLVKKELRIQQLTFVVAGLCLLAWTAGSLLRHVVPALSALPIEPLTILYLGVLSLLIGSLASAEERQLGTVEWQMLLPVASWQQWAIKAGVALGLALALGFGLPAAIWYFSPYGAEVHHIIAPRWVPMAIAVVLLTACSLYVSSLCASGVQAMVASLATALGALLLVPRGIDVLWTAFSPLLRSVRGIPVTFPAAIATVTASKVTALAMAAGLVALLLWFALLNHRSAERGARRILVQAISMVTILAAGVLLTAAAVVYVRG